MLINAFRLTRTQRPSLSSSYTYNLPSQVIRKPSTLRFAKASSSGVTKEMNPKEEPDSKARDSMSCFGEGYATRADEEGFGGIYGGKEDDDRDKGPKHAQGDEKEFDHSQGSEVKEKERARNAI